MEKVDNLHIISLLYKLLSKFSWYKWINVWIWNFQKTRRRLELTNHKTEKGLFHVRIKLTDIFGFADQNKVTHGLGYSLTMKRNSDNNVIVRDRGTDNAKINIKDITWFVPHYTPNIENQTLVMEQLLIKNNRIIL